MGGTPTLVDPFVHFSNVSLPQVSLRSNQSIPIKEARGMRYRPGQSQDNEHGTVRLSWAKAREQSSPLFAKFEMVTFSWTPRSPPHLISLVPFLSLQPTITLLIRNVDRQLTRSRPTHRTQQRILFHLNLALRHYPHRRRIELHVPSIIARCLPARWARHTFSR